MPRGQPVTRLRFEPLTNLFSKHPQPQPDRALRSIVFAFLFMGFRVRKSVRRPFSLAEFSPSRQILAKYLKIGLDSFLPNPFQSILSLNCKRYTKM